MRIPIFGLFGVIVVGPMLFSGWLDEIDRRLNSAYSSILIPQYSILLFLMHYLFFVTIFIHLYIWHLNFDYDYVSRRNFEFVMQFCTLAFLQKKIYLLKCICLNNR